MKGGVLGIVGGGQLGMMTAHAAKNLGVIPRVFSMEKNAPAAQHAEVTYGHDDIYYKKLRQWANECDAITFEFEHIPTTTLNVLNECDVPLRPNVNAIKMAQNRIEEKNFLKKHEIPIAEWIPLVHETLQLESPILQQDFEKKAVSLVEKLRTLDETLEPIEKVRQEFEEIFPVIVKTAQGGYDGLGQIQVSGSKKSQAKKLKELKGIFEKLSVPLVVEQKINFKAECSMIGARGITGDMVFYPLTQNFHNKGILIRSLAPMAVSSSLTRQAERIVGRMMEALNFVGILAVEFFLLRDDTLLVNECAPRPHNSGHWTLDGVTPDQFTQLVWVTMGESPQVVRQTASVEMVNILGKEKIPLPQHQKNYHKKTRFYGKEVSKERPRRKLGHVNYFSKISAQP